MNSTVDWRAYQRETAGIFSSLGLNVTIEERLRGARSTHAIDVVVRFERFGLEHLWICECKAWSTAVPQEKVDAFASVVEDVGAHHGLMFSLNGFQSGAYDGAMNRSITLTSVDEFSESASDELARVELVAVAKRSRRTADLIESWQITAFPDPEDRLSFQFSASPIPSIATSLRSLAELAERVDALAFPVDVLAVIRCEKATGVFDDLWNDHFTLARAEVRSAQELLAHAWPLVGNGEALVRDLQAGRSLDES